MPLILTEATQRVHEWFEEDESWEAHDADKSRFPEEADEENVVAIELKQTVTRKDRIPEIDPELEQKFNRLAAQWRQKTMFMSHAADITSDFTYYQIIGLGPSIVPLILRQVQRGEGHWFLALRALTGENPVKVEDAGSLAKMAKSWLDWGKRHGLIYGKSISMQEARQIALRTSVEIEKRRHEERADESRFLLNLWEDEDSNA